MTLSLDWQQRLARLEADLSLFEPERIRERLEVLDDLEMEFGGVGFDGFGNRRMDAPVNRPINPRNNAPADARGRELRDKLEAANAGLYRSIRAEIRSGLQQDALRQRIRGLLRRGDAESPAPGLSYDYRDELVSGILGLGEPLVAGQSLEAAHASPEMVFYQPTPARHILDFLERSGLGEDDVLIDLGSGLGHVPLLASMLTGARSVGVEVDAAYVACARQCAESLCLDRVTFHRQDAREADLSDATVVYLYTPFSGSILFDVLVRLREQSLRRPKRICTLGPCATMVAKEPWLRAETAVDTERITVFHGGS